MADSDGWSSRQVIDFPQYNFADHPLSSVNGESTEKAVLEKCVYDGYVDSSFRGCGLGDVPMIGMLSPRPDVDTIMSRVLFSKPWMAERFRQVLESLPADALLLFRPLTAVVISHDIRPSFYWPVTGAIYIDPAYLWMTESEFLDTPQFPDYRSGYGDALAFDELARYVRDNRYVTGSGKIYDGDRAFDEVFFGSARLLAHELAHANDYIPGPVTTTAHPAFTPLDIVVSQLRCVDETSIGFGSGCNRLPPASYQASEVFPLASSILRCAGRQMFLDSCAEAEDFAASAISLEFQAEPANDLYNYTNSAEDVAMLFEEFFMQHYFDVARDFAVTNNPPEGATGADYIVDWGQRGRIGADMIEARLTAIVSHLLPEIDAGAAVASLPDPLPLRAAESWVDNLDPSASGLHDDVQKQRALTRDVREDHLSAHGFRPPLPVERDQ